MTFDATPSNQPTIRPCLVDLLRTCVYPPSLALRIDKVQVEKCDLGQGESSSEKDAVDTDRMGKAYRLFLSDDVLVLQALLENRLLESISLEDCVEGNIIVLKLFKVKRAAKVSGQGEVVFLGIKNCEFVVSRMPGRRSTSNKRLEQGGLDDEVAKTVPTKKVKLNRSPSHGGCMSATDSAEASDSDDFETSTFDRRALDRRRRALEELHQNRSFELSNSVTVSDNIKESISNRHPPEQSSTSTALVIPERQTATKSNENLKSQHSPTAYTSTGQQHAHKYAQTAKNPLPPRIAGTKATTASNNKPTSTSKNTATHPPPSPSPFLLEPPYHTLLSLEPTNNPTPPPRKSYHCTIFAIISWISPSLLYPRPSNPNNPSPNPSSSSTTSSSSSSFRFPPKRHIKIHDRSLTTRRSGTTVAVHCDALHFLPARGTVALFRDLVMQTTVGGEVILNAYPSLMANVGIGGIVGRWIETDDVVLKAMGWDVDGLRTWWVERERERGGKGGR